MRVTLELLVNYCPRSNPKQPKKMRPQFVRSPVAARSEVEVMRKHLAVGRGNKTIFRMKTMLPILRGLFALLVTGIFINFLL